MDDTNEQQTTRIDLSPPDFEAWDHPRPSPPADHPVVAATDRGEAAEVAQEPTLSQMTFASKLPPDHPGLQLDRARPRALRKGPILVTVTLIAGIVGIAMVVALSPRGEQAKAATATLPDAPAKGNISLPDSLQNAPGNGGDLHAPPPLGPPLHGADPRTAAQQHAGSGSGVETPRRGLRQAVLDERVKALSSPILVDLEAPGQDPGSVAASLKPPVASAATSAEAAAPGSPASALAGDQNFQQHKSDFLSHEGSSSAAYLAQPVLAPRSPYEVKAGTVIPTVLISGINSDLPGQIVGQVRENVYDTVTGNYLLIPQGSRLIATYDSAVSYGQERVLVCWNRLIRPDGISISLECMPGVDLAGYAGFTDDVDHHWWKIITGVALGTLLSATAEHSQGNVSGYTPTMPQLWASNAGGAINQAGQQITQKNLAIQPTIKVRPGYTVNVLVGKDIVLVPYSRALSP
jgi:type IV secretion system protein VirB10